MEIAISEFKAKCIRLLKLTSETGEELVVTLRGKPLARIVGIKATPPRRLGGQRDAIERPISDSILIDSDLDRDWES